MKYWNKGKKCRDHWTHVEIVNNRWHILKVWCQRHESKGKFYSGPYKPFAWYFEDPQDALVFKLILGYK